VQYILDLWCYALLVQIEALSFTSVPLPADRRFEELLTSIKKRAIPYKFSTRGQLRHQRRYTDTGEVYSNNLYLGDSTEAFKHLIGIQVTESETHPAWKHPHPWGVFRGDLGGPFTMRKRYAESLSGSAGLGSPWVYDGYNQQASTTYSGPFLPIAPNFMAYPPYADSPDSELYKFGTEAISKVSPSNPVADLSVLLGETVREGLPALLGATLRKWRGMSGQELRNSIGHEYLNVEFGWKPLVNDLRKVSKAIRDRDALWAQYERDAGKLVRRRFEFPEIVTEKIQLVQQDTDPWYLPSGGVLSDPSRNNRGKVYRTDKVTIRRWFSGAFVYYLPVTVHGRGQVASNVLQAKKLLGLTLTPDTVWNLMPWSWALDWFSNTGDIINNWSNWAFDGQVLKYGYIMEHTVSERTYTYTGPTGLRSSVLPYDVVLVSETKLRRQATPYGFGLDVGKLSLRQQAIIAALGLAKS